jgi:succinate dehydrogenase / fumarate reductase cytochrome b subunit
MHIFVTSSRLGGPESWDKSMAFFHHPMFVFGEFMVFLAFVFHALNGIRLVFTELGYAVGKPSIPAYPYRHSVLRQKPFLVFVMVVAAALMIIGGADFYFAF